MNKLSVKDIIRFNSKSDRSKKTFVANLKIDKKKSNTEDGGDYWVCCLSAVSNAFKNNDNSIILGKIKELEKKHEDSKLPNIKKMYERNISILNNFIKYDFNKLLPSEGITIVKKHKLNSLFDVNGLQVQALPQHVFTFKNENKELGAIWFVAILDGYSKSELAMFSDILYRYLSRNYSKEYKINPDYCVAVDVVNVNNVNYRQIINKNILTRVDLIIDEIRMLM